MEKQYTAEDVKAQIKPLSDNAFIAFFQKIWRAYLGWWYGFADKHPKAAKWGYQLFFFFIFSQGVTIWQFIVMTFLPYAFAGLGTEPWGFPGIVFDFANRNGAQFIIFGDTNGLGYFIAFEIAVFTAQCINFPLQRNITYKSKGNPWIQAMWYFIGWVLISIFVNAVWGFINVFATDLGWYLPGNEGWATVAGLIKTFITGGISMAIFFPIFLIIFPDLEKMAVNAEKKVEALKAANASAEQIATAEAKATKARAEANLDAARRNEISANTLASAKALSWEASIKLLETMKADSAKYTAEEVAAQEKAVEEKYQLALEATSNKYAAIEAYAALKA